MVWILVMALWFTGNISQLVIIVKSESVATCEYLQRRKNILPIVRNSSLVVDCKSASATFHFWIIIN